MNHVDNDPTQLDVQATGTGDMAELVGHLDDKQAQYALSKLSMCLQQILGVWRNEKKVPDEWQARQVK